MWYPKFTPPWVQGLFKGLVWNGPKSNNQIYLTFDDGPNTGSTDSILKTLSNLDVKATFFCVGQNIEKNRGLLKNMLAKGHQVGGHSFSHCNGWKTPFKEYIQNVNKGQALISTQLFRPPYGRLTFRQMNYLKNREKVVMWDVIPGDFDPSRSVADCMRVIKKHTRPGSIIVLHDNPSYCEKVTEIVRQMVFWAREEGFVFDVLSD